MLQLPPVCFPPPQVYASDVNVFSLRKLHCKARLCSFYVATVNTAISSTRVRSEFSYSYRSQNCLLLSGEY